MLRLEKNFQQNISSLKALKLLFEAMPVILLALCAHRYLESHPQRGINRSPLRNAFHCHWDINRRSLFQLTKSNPRILS